MNEVVAAIILGVFPTAPQKRKLEKLRGPDGEFVGFPLKDVPSFIDGSTTGSGVPAALGIPVAIANRFKEAPGAVDLPVCRVEDLSKVLKKPLALATKRWKQLAKWASANGVELGEPSLILGHINRG
ncbi:hypothetical protein [Corallococcus carmarthensis]|uniref:Uncharacterized protein n=1 Tax=Corallococcus carmarthensis TaxID=2316728 RepID=A0A3A8KLB1_9BACT|nr:hypothetical protein [Corallococcus carmarthensis]RKH05041.1 hypothetical protein D7X32_08970 [Corallococcus carmarthensis]